MFYVGADITIVVTDSAYRAELNAAAPPTIDNTGDYRATFHNTHDIGSTSLNSLSNLAGNVPNRGVCGSGTGN
jgi:hypothetical protein